MFKLYITPSANDAVTVPDPLPVEGRPIQPQPESDSPPRILCGAISADGVLALCDDHKQVNHSLEYFLAHNF